MKSDCGVPWYTPEFVNAKLESAGKTIMILPRTDRPVGHRSGWVDYVREWWDVYGRHDPGPVRMCPTLEQMNEFEEILDWLPLVRHVRYRKVLGYRMLVWPDSERHVWSWRRIGERMNIAHETVRIWHKDALRHLADQLNMGL